MSGRSAAALLVAAAAVAPAFGQPIDSGFEDHLLKQLSCKSDPDPTAILLFLNKTKRISLDKGDKADSETCWSVEPALTVRGAAFSHVCASAEDALLIYLFPKLYWRGPGTSAGTGVRLVTDMDLDALRGWAKQELGDGPYQVESASSADGASEVSCNNLWRR
jgi:hypothetical protein